MAKGDNKAKASAAAPEGAVADAVVAEAPVAEAPVEQPATIADVQADVVKLAEDVAEVVDEFVTVTVPKAFNLALDYSGVVRYAAGVQQMLKSHAEHWYSAANGVQVYDPKADK